jgi:hypothetical protein
MLHVVVKSLVVHHRGGVRGVLGDVREVVECAIGDEAACVLLLDGDLARKHALLILADELHVGAQGIEAGLHFGEHRACDLADHRQAVAPADVTAEGGLARGVTTDEIDPHRPRI